MSEFVHRQLSGGIWVAETPPVPPPPPPVDGRSCWHCHRPGDSEDLDRAVFGFSHLGWREHDFCCGHPDTVTCPDCYKASHYPIACVRCGHQMEYT